MSGKKKGTRDIYRQQAMQVLQLFEAGMHRSALAQMLDTDPQRITKMIKRAQFDRAQAGNGAAE